MLIGNKCFTVFPERS